MTTLTILLGSVKTFLDTQPKSIVRQRGGKSSHMDLSMKGCTLYLDDELIVKDGDVISKDMRAGNRSMDLDFLARERARKHRRSTQLKGTSQEAEVST